MEWLANNWFWVLLVVVFIAMRLSGRGCCGGRRRSAKEVQGKENSADS